MKTKKEQYPRIKQLGLKIIEEPIPHVLDKDLVTALKKHNIDKELFSKYFGVQTRIESGAYAHDIEAVLERLMSGKLIGTQSFNGWD